MKANVSLPDNPAAANQINTILSNISLENLREKQITVKTAGVANTQKLEKHGLPNFPKAVLGVLGAGYVESYDENFVDVRSWLTNKTVTITLLY